MDAVCNAEHRRLMRFRFENFGYDVECTHRAQYPLIEEYTSNYQESLEGWVRMLHAGCADLRRCRQKANLEPKIINPQILKL